MLQLLCDAKRRRGCCCCMLNTRPVLSVQAMYMHCSCCLAGCSYTPQQQCATVAAANASCKVFPDAASAAHMAWLHWSVSQNGSGCILSLMLLASDMSSICRAADSASKCNTCSTSEC
jgi:hypothetical protein